ncbi:hypothetical protein [Streptomyces sp. NPDC003077]|uniref:hypothetical protein n=1 Tax=Streptomyces sp. NPDC003077 TaxID=3154443 RepID=UPI0033AC80A0
MHPPHFSVGTWWIIAAITTALFLAVCVPLMPSPKYKLRISGIPLLGILYLGGDYWLKDHGPEQALSIHSVMMLTFLTFCVASHKTIKRAVEEERLYGSPTPSPNGIVRGIAIVFGGLLLWLWLNYG